VICAEAFLGDPAMVALIPRSEARRRTMLRRWFRALLGIARRWSGRPPMAVFYGDELTAVAIAYDEGRYPAPSRSGLLAAPGMVLAGPWAVMRSLRWMLARERHHPRDPHIYLETLAVAPTRQRQGAGTMLLEALCEDADRRVLPIVLHTNHPDNLPYYMRFGFEVEHEATLPHGPREWLMRR
jgi:ribosomal protein S18 acetylase RimI-like enzyme